MAISARFSPPADWLPKSLAGSGIQDDRKTGNSANPCSSEIFPTLENQEKVDPSVFLITLIGHVIVNGDPPESHEIFTCCFANLNAREQTYFPRLSFIFNHQSALNLLKF